MEAFAAAYVPDALRSDALVSPLSGADLSELPRTLCITAECDILRDQRNVFGERLRKAGISVTERCFAGAVHLFVTVAGMDGDFWRDIGECTGFYSSNSSQPVRPGKSELFYKVRDFIVNFPVQSEQDNKVDDSPCRNCDEDQKDICERDKLHVDKNERCHQESAENDVGCGTKIAADIDVLFEIVSEEDGVE